MLQKIDLDKIPNNPGVYIFKDKNGKILYIGKAKNLKKRIQQYFLKNSVWKVDMLNQADNLEILEVDNETEALNLEENLIKKYKPNFNLLLKDNFRYVWIKFTNEDFPQIKIVKKKLSDGAIYIGPKYNSKNLKEFLHYFRQIFGYRDCPKTKFNQGKLCGDYYFGLCKGRCKKKDDLEVKLEYDKILEQIKKFFSGDYENVEKYLKKQLDLAIKKQNFERAAKLRDLYFSIQKVGEKNEIYLQSQRTGKIVKIKKYGDFWVYVMLNFFDGRLVDVVMDKKENSQFDFDKLLLALKMEFLDKDKNFLIYFQDKEIFSSLKSKFISSNELEIIKKLFDKFFESFLISSGFQKDGGILSGALELLKERYNLKNLPYHIEAIDISHIGGSWTAGGLSCLLGGIPFKKYYRRYKIPLEIAGNDYASLEFILTKRLLQQPLPSLILIDGGKGQLNILTKLISSLKNLDSIDFLALQKGKARKRSGKFLNVEKIYGFVDKIGGKIFEKDIIYDEIDKILLKARDEAHRFANEYRKKLMEKEFK